MNVAPGVRGLLRLDNQICFALHAASRAFDALYRATLGLTEDGHALRDRLCPLPSQVVGATGMSLAELKQLKSTLRELTDALDVAAESAST